MTASKGDMRELKETCVRLLRLGWQDTDQCFEKLSHVIEFKTRGDTAQALSHWQAALRYRAAAAKSLNEAAFILNTGSSPNRVGSGQGWVEVEAAEVE